MPRSAAAEIVVAEPGRRDLIADAARRCFARWGVSRTRMEDIAKECGVPRPVLYRHYASKEALLVEVMVRHIDRRREELHRRVRRRGRSAPLIVEALRAGITGGTDRAVSDWLLDDDVRHLTARLVAGSAAVSAAMAEYWRPYLEYARDRGELRPGVELDEAARWLTFMVFHFLSVPETVPPADDLPRYLRTFVVNALVA